MRLRARMRRPFAIPLFILGLIVVVGVIITFNYITLLFDSVTDNTIDFENVTFDKSTGMAQTANPQLMPKIIHQTWKNDTVPEQWKSAQESCLSLHPDFEYKLWTDESSRQFIAEEFPWFLETFDSYPFNIMRADVIRYFVLEHFGGIYIDLDEGCKVRLDPLLTYPAWVRRAEPTGVSNSVMGSTPHHPFYMNLMLQLKNYNFNWGVPYITVMYSTGPLFVSVIWKQFKRWATTDAEQVWILPPPTADSAYFVDLHGSSWHEDDAEWIMFMGVHWLAITILGFLLATVVGLTSYIIVRRVYAPRRAALRYKHLGDE
ncbi:nucleotide-diphospho-sugar transferase [Lipomyces arxii]|uniref:nucleotide-diphospho-sugar transferase n=1 Tax=Lipomyces arxii TaxID=56418 RepID=UPI0034CFC864